ncbi:nicotinamide mononucleotide transporter [Myroides odoratimimus]|uniref:Nicotinamide riboside transporter PnuC n=2 Tax=Myroides odoratimimus TaxID=76832 RepID=A0A0S7EBB6_9FLAO|nr:MULTISPECIES: nicotinamide riboside transporter PnuC [Myroides]AJA68043.1 nicotinamide mononucleotide transporter PnuC [Myroides sp. A21]ALU25356.1 nicotinamide mononucleotide transporter [Myroides odoratimimus]EHO05079.1 nicotinamide mononucleotide transporter PnuC [Myroides odoratimimus CCUG 12901]EHO06708.1 nicotinamide mononucleotide transporter PnuC [Myroides odoratimimus CCUG 10230]EKB02950.1 nicotinamide mononucleotide transporter PnuC [Myroides odoratimimus CCUG 3837]
MIDFFFGAYRETSTLQIVLESIVFIFGIMSVWYAGKENILVYPTGIIATIITVYLLYVIGYYGDMILNGYYSIMSVYGWYNWSRQKDGDTLLKISRTNTSEKIKGLIIFAVTLVIIYGVYHFSGKEILPENYIDIITSGIFFTGMYYMALKKIENWTLWIIGDIISVPLYAYRGYGILAVQFAIFTVLATMAYISWYKTINREKCLEK